MFQRLAYILLAIFILTGCQNISKDDLKVLQARADKADQLEQTNILLKEEQESLIRSVNQLNDQLDQEIAEKKVLVEQNTQTGVIKITMQQDILFPSGSYNINQDNAADILNKLARSLDGNNMLRIVGHTDNLPIQKKWRTHFSDNWDLSARRAGEVARYLIWGTGFTPENIEVVGRAHVEPVTGNDTKEDRALNRRIELFVKK